MAPKRDGEVVTEFLREMMPPGIMECYDLLARLDYPIHDRKSLSTVLKAEKKKTSALPAMLEVFEAADFPLSSVRNALEKLSAHLTPQPFLGPLSISEQ